ncbi:MAG: hypothetical protein Unbinned5081contig1002_68 [Prokaryotic dsDNA virus sp.]|nr:MAG: hypothetical protein Unbinned5081contig1002_68 [Prokaryotic dsDNA virus sp.]|tara:strand:+ start:7128 stop:7310 length:183 start_codon:yes stop_codon:yes gene_type:complete
MCPLSQYAKTLGVTLKKEGCNLTLEKQGKKITIYEEDKASSIYKAWVVRYLARNHKTLKD